VSAVLYDRQGKEVWEYDKTIVQASRCEAAILFIADKMIINDERQ